MWTPKSHSLVAWIRRGPVIWRRLDNGTVKVLKLEARKWASETFHFLAQTIHVQRTFNLLQHIIAINTSTSLLIRLPDIRLHFHIFTSLHFHIFTFLHFNNSQFLTIHNSQFVTGFSHYHIWHTVVLPTNAVRHMVFVWKSVLWVGSPAVVVGARFALWCCEVRLIVVICCCCEP